MEDPAAAATSSRPASGEAGSMHATVQAASGKQEVAPLLPGGHGPHHSNALPAHLATTAPVPQLSDRRERLPPITADYLVSHHRLMPRNKASSAYVKRHAASHGMMPGQLRSTMLQQTQTQDAGRPPAAVRQAILKALASTAETNPGRVLRSAGTEATQTAWSSTSIGDLETLDSILDHLVVKDANMREALLKGPLISFETVVPEARPKPWYQPDLDYKDETFITGVKGVEEAALGEEQEEQQLPAMEPEEQQEAYQEVYREVPAYRPRAQEQAPSQETLRESIPIPVLPKLARMYITSKQSQAVKGPPLPPPTAEYLMRSRPAPVIAAPSYDELCTQIRDVQRQYTCGTGKDRQPAPGPGQRTNMDVYISGLDGPPLDELVMYEEVPISLENARPSFISMKKGTGKHLKARASSRERGAVNGGRTQSPERAT